MIGGRVISCEIALRWMSSDLTVNIGSGNGLVPPGTKPLPKPLLTEFYVAIQHHKLILKWQGHFCSKMNLYPVCVLIANIHSYNTEWTQ